MNDTLSSLIAFIGFLIVFSMLIQSVQEALKNLFKLKTGVWERFFLDLYKTDFQMKDLQPETPFWKRVKSGSFVGEFEERLKRIKKVIIKADGLLKDTKKKLREIMGTDLTGLDDNKPAPALLKIERLGEQICKITAMKIDSMLDLYNKNNKDVIHELLEKLAVLSAVFDDVESRRPEDIKDVCKEFHAAVRELEARISAYRVQIESKADAWLVQIEGEYKKNMLKWTLIISICSVVILNADTFSIYQYFSINSKAQELMVANAANAVAKINDLRADDLNAIDRAIQADEPDKAREGILALSKQLAEEFALLSDIADKDKAEAVLKDTQGFGLTAETGQKFLKDQYGKLTALYIALQKKSINFQMEGLNSTGLPLGWRNDFNTIRQAERSDSLILVIKKLVGLTLTIFLVSFGAPFWQNIINALIGLKNMNLKPGAGASSG
ncbi:MAG: hypothetical protein A2277_14715 [Desulfobacterales bacterium RIFOXYA12_FULL_46_15]|nr:MAG: hypothetical protein A2277_14715 [Desulfobacterales bacterium RIFOXYA12_FULL_46_15]